MPDPPPRSSPAAPLDRLDRVDHAIRELRARTDPSVVLAEAPRALGSALELERTVLSLVDGGTLTPVALWMRGADARTTHAELDALRGSPAGPAGASPALDAIRRARTVLADDAVLAPITLRGRTVALIDARAGRPTEVDRALVEVFASDLSIAHEAAQLRGALRREREEMGHLLRWLDRRSRDLGDAASTLEPVSPTSEAPQPTPGEAFGAGTSDAMVFDGVLTRREVEVLRLLAEGFTNGEIAADLVISPGTVKFHVNHVLRKLRVANRAQAVSRYYALVQRRPTA